jgi:hypothetical protein
VNGIPVPTDRREVTVIPTGYDFPLSPLVQVRIPPGQQLYHARVAGLERWCTREPVLIFAQISSMRPMSACFVDRAGTGRFSEVYMIASAIVPSGGASDPVNVPYVLEISP